MLSISHNDGQIIDDVWLFQTLSYFIVNVEEKTIMDQFFGKRYIRSCIKLYNYNGILSNKLLKMIMIMWKMSIKNRGAQFNINLCENLLVMSKLSTLPVGFFRRADRKQEKQYWLLPCMNRNKNNTRVLNEPMHTGAIKWMSDIPPGHFGRFVCFFLQKAQIQ